ncbi:IS3 family transposase [Salidesulfovibrio brasiliensis]|uniref:IS3 family transposase n=1 Tax=Salidesulfovibrio brasiliensis TaxID=221711 RepID=UPI003F71E43C
MSRKRRGFTAEFKTRVALDALSGEQSLSELAAKYGVHPNQISQWKRQAKEGVAASFSGKAQKNQQSDEARIKELHAKIGQLTVEKDFLQQAFKNLSCERRREVVDKEHPMLSVRRQCRILKLQRSTYYYQPVGESMYNLSLMKRIDELFMELPFFGSRQMRNILRDEGHQVGRGRVRRLMRKMGLMAIYQKPRTSQPHPQHKRYPYLLRNMAITRPNQVWCADITYIPMKRGFLYLVAIMDWHSRAVLSWRLSNTMDADFCVSALEDAMNRYGVPEIFNTDQGSQFTSYEFTRTLRDAGVRISMDGRGRWMDNVMIERLWKSLKYECVYLRELKTGSDLRNALVWWFDFYNNRRPHKTFDGMKPMEIYQTRPKPEGVPPLAWPCQAA